MAYQATHWAWELDLPTTQKFVLVALSDMADETFSCFPGQERLATMIGASVATVRRALATLEEHGLISRTQRRREDGYRTSDRFKLHVGRSPRKLSGDILTAQQEAPHRSSALDLTAHSGGVITSKNNQIEPPVNAAVEVVAETVEFDAFWAVYPRKVGKAAAHAKWKQLAKTGTDLRGVLAAAGRYAGDPNLPEKKFIPHPLTWLNQGRWDDEPEPVRGGSERQQASLSLVERLQREEASRAEVGSGQGADLRAIG
jgi:DNA-binding Lrp family transcriptional regulator